MSLKQLLSQGRLKPHRTSKEEIRNLLKIIKRDIKDSNLKGLSPDRKFATAYNAVLQTATILLYCEGYKPHGIGHHLSRKIPLTQWRSRKIAWFNKTNV